MAAPSPDTVLKRAHALLESPTLQSYRAQAHARSVLRSVARDPEGGLAGAAALRQDNHLFHLFVSPAWQRQGVATQLWREVMQYAKRQQRGDRAKVGPQGVALSVGDGRSGQDRVLVGTQGRQVGRELGITDTPGSSAARSRGGRGRAGGRVVASGRGGGRGRSHCSRAARRDMREPRGEGPQVRQDNSFLQTVNSQGDGP